MELMLITVASIFFVTLAVWLADKFSPVYVCPICVGVSATWLWLLGANFFGYAVNLTIPAMLMGGSVVGIAYQLDKKMPAGKSSLLWKSLFISTGFLAAYALLTLRAPLFDVLVVALIVLWLVFFKLPVHKAHESGDVKKLEEKMEECC